MCLFCRVMVFGERSQAYMNKPDHRGKKTEYTPNQTKTLPIEYFPENWP